MSLDLPAFADAEEVMYELLQPLNVPVVKATPQQFNTPLILIHRMGGHSDYITDFAQILVTVFGGTRPEAMNLQLRCQQLIENAFCTEVTLDDNSVVLIDGSQTIMTGHPEAYENIDLRQVPALYELRMRRPIVAPH